MCSTPLQPNVANVSGMFQNKYNFNSNWPMSCSILLSQINGPNGQNLASLDQNVIPPTVQASWWFTCQSLVTFLRHRGFKMKRLFPKEEKRKWGNMILMRNWFKESIWRWGQVRWTLARFVTMTNLPTWNPLSRCKILEENKLRCHSKIHWKGREVRRTNWS